MSNTQIRAKITIEPSYTYEGILKPDHESACIVDCPCGATTSTWARLHRPTGAVAADCDGCGAYILGPATS